MRKNRHVVNLLKFLLAHVTFEDFLPNRNFYIDTPSYLFIPYESWKFHRKLTKLCSVLDVFSFHPPNLWVCWLGISIYDVLFSLTTTFFHTFSHQNPTPPHHQPPPTTPHHPPPSLPPNHSTLHADGAEQLGRTLRSVEISVAGRHGQRVRGPAGNQKFPRISGCYG